MNLADDAVPTLGPGGFAIPVSSHGLNVNVVANADKYLRPHVSRGGLVAVHFHQQLPEMAVWPCVGPLRVFTESHEPAESSAVRAALIVLRFENKAGDPLPPLPRPCVCRFCTTCDVDAGVKQRKGFAERNRGLLPHFEATRNAFGTGHSCSRKNPHFTPS